MRARRPTPRTAILSAAARKCVERREQREAQAREVTRVLKEWPVKSEVAK